MLESLSTSHKERMDTVSLNMEIDLLAGIDQIKWADVDHAYGEATNLPDTLRDLQSPDEDTHESALFYLYSSICHQGTRYTATPLAIPFLYRLVDRPETPNRGKLLELIATLSFGLNSDDLPLGTDVGDERRSVAEFRQDPDRFDIIKKGLDEFLAGARNKQGRQYLNSYIDSLRQSGTLEDEQGWWSPEIRSYNAVESGLDTAYRCLKDDSSTVRVYAAYLLAWVPEQIGSTTQHLMDLLISEENIIVQATAVISLATLQSMREDFDKTHLIHYLREFQSKSSPGLASWASSLSLVKLGANTEAQLSEVMKVFGDDKKYLEQIDQDLRETDFPFISARIHHLESLAVREIRHLKGSRNPEIVKALISKIPFHHAAGIDLIAIASSLLNIAFDGVKPTSVPDFDSLSDLQKGVMRALNTKLEKQVYHGCLMMVLGSWNLPMMAEDFKAFIKHPGAFQSRL